MQLLTVGDSFTYGAELADPQTSAWPSLLANKTGYKLTNLAKPGSGNTRMIRQCIEQVDSYDMVVIAWSHFARIEMADEGGFFDIWPGISTVFFKDNLPYTSISAFSEKGKNLDAGTLTNGNGIFNYYCPNGAPNFSFTFENGACKGKYHIEDSERTEDGTIFGIRDSLTLYHLIF